MENTKMYVYLWPGIKVDVTDFGYMVHIEIRHPEPSGDLWQVSGKGSTFNQAMENAQYVVTNFEIRRPNGR